MSGSPGGGVIAGLGGNPSLANIIAKRAPRIIRILNREIPSVRIDAAPPTSDLVTTRTVKSDHLKFWYLKPNFKDKEVDLLLRVARHRTGTYWEVSYGVQQLPAQQGGALHLQGIGSITAAAALTAAAPELQGALADANAQALALLASPNQHNPFEAEHVHAGHVVKAVVVSEAIDIGMPDSMGLGLGGLQGVEGHLDHAQHVSMGMHGLGAEHADDGALHAHALHAHAHIAPALEAAHLQHLAEQMVAHEMGMHLQAPLSLAASHEYPSLLAHEAPHPSLLGGDPNELHAYRLHAYRHDVSLSVAHEQHHDGSQDLPMAQSAPLYLDAVPMTQEAPMMHYAGSAHDHDVTHLTMHSGEVQIELA
ncbi:hypothetical protein T492DRAFT_968067 [Pavlovales sp. CCMP2436]|nr:hypothetical protein T492DRAFT_968067 [Pavlovales sp. CCMP2436]